MSDRNKPSAGQICIARERFDAEKTASLIANHLRDYGADIIIAYCYFPEDFHELLPGIEYGLLNGRRYQVLDVIRWFKTRYENLRQGIDEEPKIPELVRVYREDMSRKRTETL